MTTAIITTIFAGLYVATLAIGMFRMRTTAWNWGAVAIAAVTVVWTAATGSWIASGIWLFSTAIAANILRMRLKFIRREAEHEAEHRRRMAEIMKQINTTLGGTK